MERVAFSAYGSKGLSREETGSGEPQYVTIASPDSGITSQEMASPITENWNQLVEWLKRLESLREYVSSGP
jgi:hypothetical protein